MKPHLVSEQGLELLPLTVQHEEFYCHIANIPAISWRVNVPVPYTHAHFDAMLKSLAVHEDYYVWIIEREGQFCGVISTALKTANSFQGGQWVLPDYAGRGIATQALKAVNRFLMEQRGAVRIQAVVEPDNAASIRVLEKCGYEREGLLRKYYTTLYRGVIDVAMYSVIRT